MKVAALCCLSVLLLGLVGTGCLGPRFRPNPPAAAWQTNFTAVTNLVAPQLLQPPSIPFTLGPGDRLEIEILGHPETRAETFVGPDGKIYYHLLPALDVWGLTLEQTRRSLETELGKYVSAPQVVVTLREVGSKSIWLLGRLNRPGLYPMASPVTLLEAISLAGGTARSTSPITSQDLADLRHAFLMRQGQFLPVDFYRLVHEGDATNQGAGR